MKKTKILFSCVLASALTSINATEILDGISVESSTINDTFDQKHSEISSTSYITADDVEKINPKSVADILNTIPGVTSRLVGTDSLKIHIRGIDEQMYMGEKPGVAIVIDGVPVQETSGKINIDIDNIESIKVIKGGASYLYGNDAEGYEWKNHNNLEVHEIILSKDEVHRIVSEVKAKYELI